MKKVTPLFVFFLFLSICASAEHKRPNVLIVMVDDQGYGDFSAHGHPFLKTPSLDKLHAESLRLTDFHVASLCTPTRGQLMTGVDALRNGAVAVCQGRSMVRKEIPTMANYFSEAGYQTILVGKWHLGDSYPYRPQDRGFKEVLANRGFGIPSLAANWENHNYFPSNKIHCYQDPVLEHNGKDKRFKGYVTDVLFENAMKYMKDHHDQGQPFFLYLATQTPHVPDLTPKGWVNPYPKTYKGLKVPEKYYGMIQNIDENMGKLDEFLKMTGIKKNTIVIYMSDNGTQSKLASQIYNSGMRGHKTTVFEGGHRVPCFIRWPNGNLKHGVDIETNTQVQDILPTLKELAGLKFEERFPLDGVSLVPLLRNQPWDHADRTICIQYEPLHSQKERIATAKLWKGAVAMKNEWRISIAGNKLYNIHEDPSQEVDVSSKYPELTKQMNEAYLKWYNKAILGYRQSRQITLGDVAHPEVLLYASDWDGGYNDNLWTMLRSNTFGKWHVNFMTSGKYKIELSRWPFESGKKLSEPATKNRRDTAKPIDHAILKIGDEVFKKPQISDLSKVSFTLDLKKGANEIEGIFLNSDGKELCSPSYVRVMKL